MKHRIMLRIWIISLAAFILLCVNVLNGNTGILNDLVYSHINFMISPVITNFMRLASDMADRYAYVLVVLLLLTFKATRNSTGFPLAIAIAFSAVTNNILKSIFSVQRPDIHRLAEASGYGFPSGHSMSGIVFYGFCTFLLIRNSDKYINKAAVITMSCAFILLTGFSRIYLGVHTVSDVIGGYLAGTIVLTASIFAVEKIDVPL